jgi:hypothetical protein
MILVTSAEALKLVHGYASANRVRFAGHARARAAQRGASVQHVMHALRNATGCAAGDADRWKVTGPDLDGDSLTAVVLIEDGIVVVTVF